METLQEEIPILLSAERMIENIRLEGGGLRFFVDGTPVPSKGKETR